MYKESDFVAIERMEPISLREMDSISLMNRIDTKFVTNVRTLMRILDDASETGYRISEICGQRLLGYKSVYYDTPDLRMFTAHRNGKKTRQKVRVRTYLVSNETFLEIKRKNNKGRTKKKRTGLPCTYAMNFGAYSEAAAFLEKMSLWTAGELSPEATTDFSRFTLVSRSKNERVTIDLNLSFRNLRSGIEAFLGDCVIIELKQDGRYLSEMRPILLKHRVFPYRISKYCIAVALTDPDARPGRFIEKLRYITKITGKEITRITHNYNDTITD